MSQKYISLKILITTCNLKWREICYSVYNFMNLDNMIFLPVRKVRKGKKSGRGDRRKNKTKMAVLQNIFM